METRSHIYKVSFKEPKNGKTDYFFSSLSAIFTLFTPEEIGCRVTQLWKLRITGQKPYRGRKCTITKEPLNRKRKKVLAT
jgi:hypothetical protein